MGTWSVTVYGELAIAAFAKKYADSRKPLTRFLDLVRRAEWKHLVDLKKTFPAADYTPRGLIVFDVGGNKYRVLASVDFELRAVDIRDVMTHERYDREDL